MWLRWRRGETRKDEPAPPELAAAPEPEPPALEGWWFAPAGAAPQAGSTQHDHVAPAPRHAGLHAARTVLDALPFARSAHLCRVALSGRVVSDGALSAATVRTIRWCFDPSALLRSIAVEIARAALADHALDGAVGALVDRIASRPVPAPDLGTLRAAADRARDAMIDAEDRLRDAQWRIEQLPTHGGAARRDAALEDAGRARRDAATHRARAHALDALELAAGATVAELASAIDAGLRACAWQHVVASAVSDPDAVTSKSLDAAIDDVRARWSHDLDARVLAIAGALGLAGTRPEPAPAPADGAPDDTGETTQRAEAPPPSERVEEARESLLEGLRLGSLVVGLPVASADRPSFTGHPVPLREPTPPSLDLSTEWERRLRDTLRGMPPARRAARIDADESDPLACPVVLVLVEPFEHWPGVLDAVREVRDELFQRTRCLLVGELDLPSAFASGRYACSEGVAIDWALCPEDRGAAFGDAWLQTFWTREADEDAPA
jgi:hypothetical protein